MIVVCIQGCEHFLHLLPLEPRRKDGEVVEELSGALWKAVV
jgi:hypothetical protein